MEVCSVGGYNEVGGNMTAVKIGDDVIIIDMGINLQALMDYESEDGRHDLNTNKLISIGAIPDDTVIKDWRKDVRAIILGHCHLDHIAAIPNLAAKYKCPVYGSPFTIAVLKAILQDDKVSIPNPIKAINLGSIVKINNKLSFELVSVTHSTLQAGMVALHTSEGVVLYASDWKFDNHPVLGSKPNYKRLKELGKEGIKVLVCESLYATEDRKTPSEKVARELLKDVMLGVDNKGKALFVTLFASHLARIRSVMDFSKKLNRQVILMGRSMVKYVKAAESVGLVNYSKEAQLASYRRQVERVLKMVEKNPGRYVVVCTGNQGEPGSVLDRIANKELHFRFKEGDHLIFSCRVIPQPSNVANRKALEEKLRKMKVRMFKDIHVSGHAGREDLRDFINMVKPENVVPAHGEQVMIQALVDLCEEEGYKRGRNVFVMNDGKIVRFK